jgi:hypothetical protein
MYTHPSDLLLHIAPSLTRIDGGAQLTRFTAFSPAHYSTGDSEAGYDDRFE